MQDHQEEFIRTINEFDKKHGVSKEFSSHFDRMPFLITSDCNYQENILSLAHQPPGKVTEKNYGIIIGPGASLSELPEILHLGITTLVYVDIEDIVLQHTLFILKLLRETATAKEFQEHYLSDQENPIRNTKIIDKTRIIVQSSPSQVSDFPQTESPTLLTPEKMLYHFQTQAMLYLFMGDQHLLNRFETCKKAAEKIKVVTLHLDLLNPTLCQQFVTTIAPLGYKLKLINLTNLHHYDGNHFMRYTLKYSENFQLKNNLTDSLKILAAENKQDLILLFSAQKPEVNSKHIYCNQTIGLDKYFEAITQEISLINTSKYQKSIFLFINSYLEYQRREARKEKLEKKVNEVEEEEGSEDSCKPS